MLRQILPRRTLFMAALIGLLCLGWGKAATAQADDADIEAQSRALILGSATEQEAAIVALSARGSNDVVAAAILALRFQQGTPRQFGLLALLRELTGHDAETWHDWMLWQEAHPEIRPHESFNRLARDVLLLIDPDFGVFFPPEFLAADRMRIRMEEVAWGGVAAQDGIPSLDRPRMMKNSETDYLLPDDLVFGVAIDGDARAYPLRIMGWHEMMNDTIGGVPVALAYCTLCGTATLYETQIDGRSDPLVFGSSGLLYRSNKLMFDWETKSLWNQFTGQPVVGPLTLQDIELNRLPVVTTTWADWQARHPDGSVLDVKTGFSRDYGSGVVYREYFASPDLMFPAIVQANDAIAAKDYVFGIVLPGSAKAWPIDVFRQAPVLNDVMGGRNLVLIGRAESRSVRAYVRDDRTFVAGSGESELLDDEGNRWRIAEEALQGPSGQTLARLPGQISYWFAWDSFVGVKSELYSVAP